MTDLIFLDTETTGLEPDKHDIWEIAYAINDGPIVSKVLVHSLKTADPKALDLNGYFGRNGGQQPRSHGPMEDLHVRELLEGHTLVCANPTFDRMFMRARWGHEPYHYRSIDIESMALAILEYDRPKGLKSIVDDLEELGYGIPQPDHSAKNDVNTTRTVYKILRLIQREKNASLENAAMSEAEVRNTPPY